MSDSSEEVEKKSSENESGSEDKELKRDNDSDDNSKSDESRSEKENDESEDEVKSDDSKSEEDEVEKSKSEEEIEKSDEEEKIKEDDISSGEVGSEDEKVEEIEIKSDGGGSDSGSDLNLTDEEEAMVEIFENEEERLDVLKGLLNKKYPRNMKLNRRGEYYFSNYQFQYAFASIFCMCFSCISLNTTLACVVALTMFPVASEGFIHFWDFWWIFALLISPVICCCMCLWCCVLFCKTRWIQTTFSDHNQIVYVKHGNLIPLISTTTVVKYNKINEIICHEGFRSPWEDILGRYHVAIKKSNGSKLIISTPFIRKKNCQKLASTMNECLINNVHV